MKLKSDINTTNNAFVVENDNDINKNPNDNIYRNYLFNFSS